MASEQRDLKTELYGQVISHMRAKHPELIDAAYDMFWEEEYPEDFLSGLPLELAFVNFEDWFICDFKDCESGSVIDLYLAENEGAKDAALLEKLRDSVISLYEVKTAGEAATLEDLLQGGTVDLRPMPLEGMKAGDLFGARIPDFGNGPVMGSCVYPFGRAMKETVTAYFEKHFNRYKRGCEDGPPIRQFLKDEASYFNIIWINSLYKRA
ncbi:MAG: hypothetical protein M0Z59_03915 [Nitrospiraceae bacterium]|nr:hypothetical protein [Nitrospiraceae bacterium]